MSRFNKKHFLLATLALVASLYFLFTTTKHNNLPIVAIANYGPHSSLEDAITGIKKELAHQGFIENHNIRYEIADVGFDTVLIPQMVKKLEMLQPKLIIALTTPVAQTAKNLVQSTPLIFSCVTDPVEAGLLKDPTLPHNNLTGASEKQDLDLLLQFVKSLMPNANTVGILYSTSEANDKSLVQMLESSALKANMKVVAISIDQPSDIALRMHGFKDKVDFIYIGASGPIQPALPTIALHASKMNIPVFNVDSDAVKNHLVLGSFGVNYTQVGVNTAKIAAAILNGQKPSELSPIHPTAEDHKGFLSKKRADAFNIAIPNNPHIIIAE